MQIPALPELRRLLSDLLGASEAPLQRLLGADASDLDRWVAGSRSEYLGFGGASRWGATSRTGLALGFDVTQYESVDGDDWQHPEGAGVVLELAVVVVPTPRRDLEAAYQRAKSAWEGLVGRHGVRAAPVALNGSATSAPMVALLDYVAAAALKFDKHKGVWVSLRTSPLDPAAGSDQLMDHARRELPALVPLLLEAATRVRGAVDAARHDLRLDTLTGWLGEWTVHRETQGTGLVWLGGRNTIDFCGPAGDVEVKSTRDPRGGLMHLSANQVARIAGGRVSVRGLRVPAAAARALKAAIEGAPDKEPVSDPSWDLPLARLSRATGTEWTVLAERLRSIQAAASLAAAAESCDQQVLDRLDAKVWTALASAQAGVSLPMLDADADTPAV